MSLFLIGYRARMRGEPRREAMGLDWRRGWDDADQNAQAGAVGLFEVLAWIADAGQAAKPYPVACVTAGDRWLARRAALSLIPELAGFKIEANRLTVRST